MGPRSSIDVFLKLHGQRKFAKEVAASGAELEAMGLKGAKAMSAFAASGDKLKKFGRSWTHNISMPVAALGVVSGKMAMDFDRSMSLIATQAGGSAREVKGLEKAVLGMHNQFTPNERAQGLFYIESAGLRGAKAMEMLQANVKLATTGNSNLEHTVFGTVGAMNALGKEGKNFTKIAAVMNSTVGHGHMRMEELVGAISTGLVGAAKSFGVSWTGMNSAVAFFTRMGEPAQQVATRLKQTITHLATNASTKGAEALDSIGMSTERMGARIRKSGRIGPVIKELAEHLNAIGKTKANQVLTDAFGGGRFGTQVREATQRWQLLLKTEREVGKFGTAKELNRSNAIAEKQPAVKLKETWADLSTVLINLGNVVLPAAVPALEKLSSVISTAGHAFGGLSPTMQASIAGFLLLTGPVASGLGYFASGVGRALILTTKLARAGKSLQVFSSALQAGQGLSGSFGMAMEGGGVQAALQTAKGFAYSIGPALAAYGIGNVATSAMSKDWTDAGAEAGGMLLGGIAGFVLTGGNPFGAMIGTGLGSMVGEKLAQALGAKTASPLVKKLAEGSREATYWFGEQKKASKALVDAEGALKRAHQRQHGAIESVKTSQSHLTAMIRKYGPDTRPAIRAEAALAQKRWGVAKATQAIHDKEKLRGIALAGAKASARWAIGSEKEQIHLLNLRAERLGHLLHYEQFHHASRERLGELGKRIGNVLGSLHEEERKLKITGGSAAKQIGEKWTHNMMKMSSAMLKFETNPFETKLDHLGKNPGPKKLREGFEEMSKRTGGLLESFARLVEKANQKAKELESRRLPEFSLPPLIPQGGIPHPHSQPNKGKPHNKHGGRNRTQSLSIPGGARRELTYRKDGTHPLGEALHIRLESQNTLVLDGKDVAESVTRHSQRAANRG